MLYIKKAITWVMAFYGQIKRKNEFKEWSRIDGCDSASGIPYAKSYSSFPFFRRLLSAGWEMPSMRAATV